MLEDARIQWENEHASSLDNKSASMDRIRELEQHYESLKLVRL